MFSEIHKFTGLDSKARLLLDVDISREEVKNLFFDKKITLSSKSIQNISSFMTEILGLDPKKVILAQAVSELCEEILRSSKIKLQFPELNKMRRKGGFFKKLARTLAIARLSFVDMEEARLFSELLDSRHGTRNLRNECLSFFEVYEKRLIELGLWDYPLMLYGVTQVLQSNELGDKLPDEVVFVSERQVLNPKEEAFLVALSNQVKLHRCQCLDLRAMFDVQDNHHNHDPISVQEWHSIDDAAEAAADIILQDVAQVPKKLGQWTILIPDSASVRRSIVRALFGRNLPLTDNRDPTQLRSQEWIKDDLATIRMCARDYKVNDVVAWVRTRNFELCNEWERECYAKGIIGRLLNYQSIPKLYDFLIHANLYSSKITFTELSKFHLNEVAGREHLEFWKVFWATWAEDRKQMSFSNRKEPLLALDTALFKRVESLPPEVLRLKSEFGIRLHRLGQPFLEACEKLIVFSPPSDYFDQDVRSNFCFNSFERESLSTEFLLRGKEIQQKERIDILNVWLSQSLNRWIVRNRYDEVGRELTGHKRFEDILGGLNYTLEKVIHGAHQRYLPSYLPVRLKLNGFMSLGCRQEGSSLSASELDLYSRCSFRGLASRWKLRDIRLPSREPWPDSSGRIVHLAIKVMLENPKLTISDAIEDSLRIESIKGMYQSKWLLKVLKTKLKIILSRFFEDEKIYQSRCSAKKMYIEGPELNMVFDHGVRVRGVPDRVDWVEMDDTKGIFVMDYKMSSSLPKGKDILEYGYRLQLPFYGLALKEMLSLEVLGLQYIELTKKGGRTAGVFFKKFNGKGFPTSIRSNSKSLLDATPDEAFEKLRSSTAQTLERWYRQEFIAQPLIGKQECQTCDLGLLCGQRRRFSDLLEKQEPDKISAENEVP